MNTSENKNPHRIDPMYVDVIDAPSTREILSREVQYSGYVLQAAVEHYDLDGHGTTLTRDVIDMPGSVAVAALNNRNEILLDESQAGAAITDTTAAPSTAYLDE